MSRCGGGRKPNQELGVTHSAPKMGPGTTPCFYVLGLRCDVLGSHLGGGEVQGPLHLFTGAQDCCKKERNVSLNSFTEKLNG